MEKINPMRRFWEIETLNNYDLKAPLGVWGMSDLEKHIKRINDKLQQLLKNYQLLQKENKRQSELIAGLQEAKEKDREQIANLQEKITILKAATGNMNEADKKAFEKNISQYIREIDKCIGILSE